MSEIKRYNLGFMKFGPLEQCKDGELIKFEDHKAVMKEQINKMTALLGKEIEAQFDLIDEKNEWIDRYENARFKFALTSALAIFGWVVAIAENIIAH